MYEDLEILDDENELIQNFADMHLADTMRIITNKHSTPEDATLIYDALCVITAIYMQKLHNGELSVTKRTYH